MCNFFFFYVFNSQKMCNFALAKSKTVHLPLGRHALFASCEEALAKSETVRQPLADMHFLLHAKKHSKIVFGNYNQLNISLNVHNNYCRRGCGSYQEW